MTHIIDYLLNFVCQDCSLLLDLPNCGKLVRLHVELMQIVLSCKQNFICIIVVAVEAP